MMTKKLKLLTALVAITAVFWTVSKAASAHGWDDHGDFKLFGHARLVSGGIAPHEVAADLTSNCGNQPYSNTCYTNAAALVFSGVSFKPDNNSLTLKDITSLSTDYNIGGSDCGGGSPRFEIDLTSGKNIFVYFGPPPNFVNCYFGWQNTGDVTKTTAPIWDSTQLGSPHFYGTHAEAVTLAGSTPIASISVVVDGGWFTAKGQDLTIDNFRINDHVFSAKDNEGDEHGK
jgi:hypothetical protein